MSFVEESNLREEIARELAHSDGDLPGGRLIDDHGWLVVGVALDYLDPDEVAFRSAALGRTDFDSGAIKRQRLAPTPLTRPLGVPSAANVVLVVLETVTQCLDGGVPTIEARYEVVVPANGLLCAANDISHCVHKDHRHGVTATELTRRRIRDRDRFDDFVGLRRRSRP